VLSLHPPVMSGAAANAFSYARDDHSADVGIVASKCRSD